MGAMDELEVERIGRAWKAAQDQATTLYEQLREAIVTGFNDGISATALAQRSGLARELVRRTLNDAERAGRLTRPRPGPGGRVRAVEADEPSS